MAKRKDNSWENNFGIPIESQVEIPENEMKEYLKSMQLQSENVQGWIRATLDQSESIKQGYNQVLIQKDQEGKIAQRIAVNMNKNGKIEEKMFRETRTSYNDIKNNMIKEMQGIQKDVYQNGQMISSTYHDFMGRDIIPKNSNKNTTYNTKKSMKDKVLFERDQRLSAIRKEFDGSKVPHTDSRGMITNPEDAAIVSWYKHQEGLTKKQLDAAISRINQRYNNSFKALKKTFDSSNMPGEKMLDGRFSEVAFGKDGQKRYMTKEVDTINAIRDQAIAEVEKIYNNTPFNYVPKFKSPEAHQKYLEKRVLRETQNMMSGINSGAITSKNFNLTLDKFINVNDFVESFKPIASTFSNINEEIYSGLLEQGKTQLVSNMKNGVFSLGGGSFNGSKFDTSKIIKQIIDKTQIGKDKVIDNPQKANEIMSAINKQIEERIKTGATSKDKATAFTGTKFLNNAYIDKNISSIAKGNTPLTYFDFETVGSKEGRGFQPTQLSVRNGDKSFNSIIKLNNDSIDYINSIFDNIKNGQSLTDDEYRTITDLADYSIDATNPNKISAFHKKIKKGLNFNLSENQAIFNQIKEGFNILQGLTPDGKEASYTNLYNTLDAAMNAIPQDFNNSTWVAHNGRNFDTEVFRHFGVDFNKNLLDTLELSKGLYSYGQKRYYDKNTGNLLNEKPTEPSSVITKTLKGYTLDNLADFFNIDLKMGGINQHTSEYDTELNRRIADQIFADISGGKATAHRLKGPLVGKTPVSVPVGSIGIAGKTKIRDHRDSFKMDASGKLLQSEDNSFNDIQFRKNGIYSYDGFFEFENGSKYAQFTDQETGQQVLEAYRDYEELNKNLTKHFDGKFSTMDSISSEASAFSSIFKKDTGIHNLRALGKLARNKDDNTVTSGQKVRFSSIKKDSIKNVISSLDEIFAKSTMSDDEKSLVLSNIGKQMGINSTSMFTDNDIRKQIDDSSSGSLSSVRNAYIRYMNENKDHFKDSGVYNSILSSLKTATTSDLDGEVNAGSGDFYGISRRIYDAFDSNYLESLQNTPKIPQHIFVNKFTEAATKAMESAKMQFSSANKSSVVDTIFNNADDNVKNAMSGKHIINRLKKIHNIRNDSDSPLMRDIEKLTGTIVSNQGFDDQSVGGMLKTIEKQASAAGLGFGLKLNPDGSGLGMQIFNNSDMEANEKGEFFVPKSKSLSMTIPLDSGNGIINHNGMELTNFLIPEMTEGGLRINTSTESIVKHLQSVLANPKLNIFDKMKNGNVGYGQSILNSVVKNALDINPSAGTYKVSSVSDLYDTYKAGGSSVARASKMGHGLYTNFFENIFQRYAKDDPELNNMNDFKKHQAIEQIRSWYSAVSFNKGDIPENDPKYDWLLKKNPTAKQYALNKFNALKNVMPVDLTGLKESGFDSNVIGSMSANKFSLFGEFAPQEWRGINQGTNIIGGVGNASEKSMQDLNIERDIFETGVGQSVGVDYSAKARPQIYTGLLSEKQMYEGYKEYTDNLKKMDKKDGGHRYTDFYNKHGSFAPSLFEGSFVMGENLLKETTGTRGQVVSVDSLDELQNSFKKLNITSKGTHWTNLISKDGDKVTLGNDGNGYAFESDIDITHDKSFSKGDVLRSIEKKDGKYLLSFDEQIQAHRGSKFVGNEGNRLTEDTGGMSEDFMDFMRKKYNLDPRVQQFMPQVDKLRDRDLPMHVGGRYKYLLTEALKRNSKMSADDINNKLESLADNGVLAGKYFKATTNENGNISFTDNIYYDRASSSWMDYSGNKVFNTQDEFNNFMNTEKEGSDFEKLAQGFLGNNWRDIIKDNTLLTNTSLANEYEYFQGFGSGLDDMLSADGRVKMSIKEKDSIDRKLGLYSRKSGDYKNLSELLHQYVENKSESYRNAQELAESYKTMGTDFFEVNKGGNLRSAKEWLGNQGNVLKIVRKTSESQKLADNEIDVDDLARGAEWVKEAKGISLENWKETAAGMIHTKGTEAFGGQPFKVAMMLENPNDPSKSDYFSTTMPGDDLFDNVKGVSTLMFNPVGPNITKDGIVSPTDDDYLLRDVFRSASTKHRNENNATWLDDTTKAYSKYYRYTFDQVAHKDSPLFKLLHTNKVANATATKLTGLNAYEYDNLLKQTQSDDVQIRNKAQSKFNTMANTLFLNEDHVRDMLSVEEGSDIDTYKKHFENLSRMYDEMYDGDSTTDKILSDKKFGDNIKGYKNRISSILDQIVKDITVDEKGVAKKSLTGFLHRYPSTSGLDEILANINIDKGLPKGVSSLGIGLATRMNADWDGDVIRAAIPWLKNDVSGETFKAAYKEAEFLKSKENEVSKMVAERRAAKENFNVTKQDIQDADMWTSLMDKVVHNKDTSDFAGIVAKNNFDFIGQFSTFATSIRGALKEAGLDEITPNLSDAEKMQAMTVRAVFESIEQDAISSKKVAGRLMNNARAKLGKDATAEQLQTHVLSEMQNLVSILYGHDQDENKISDTQKVNGLSARMDKAFSYGKEIGLFGEGEEFLNGRQAWTAIAQMYHMGKTPEQQESIRKMMYENGLITQDHKIGTLSEDFVRKSLGQVERTVEERYPGKNLYTLGKEYRNNVAGALSYDFYGKKMAEMARTLGLSGNDEITAKTSQQQGVQQVIGQGLSGTNLGNVNIEAISSFIQALGLATQGVQSFTGAITGDLSSARRDSVYAQTLGSTRESKGLGIAKLDPVSHTYSTGIGNQKIDHYRETNLPVEQRKTASVTEIANALFGKAYEDPTPEMTKLVNDFFEKGYVEIDGKKYEKLLTDVIEAKKGKGKEANGLISRYTKGQYSTIQGSMTHKALEILRDNRIDNADVLFGDGKNLEGSELSAYNEWQKFLTGSEGATYQRQLKQMGKEFNPDAAKLMSKQGFLGLKDGGISELSLGMKIGDHEIFGTLDAFFNGRLFDYKTTEGMHPDTMGFQLGMLKRLILENGDLLVNDDKTKDAFAMYNKDGKFDVAKFSNPENFKSFIAQYDKDGSFAFHEMHIPEGNELNTLLADFYSGAYKTQPLLWQGFIKNTFGHTGTNKEAAKLSEQKSVLRSMMDERVLNDFDNAKENISARRDAQSTIDSLVGSGFDDKEALTRIGELDKIIRYSKDPKDKISNLIASKKNKIQKPQVKTNIPQTMYFTDEYGSGYSVDVSDFNNLDPNAIISRDFKTVSDSGIVNVRKWTDSSGKMFEASIFNNDINNSFSTIKQLIKNKKTGEVEEINRTPISEFLKTSKDPNVLKRFAGLMEEPAQNVEETTVDAISRRSFKLRKDSFKSVNFDNIEELQKERDDLITKRSQFKSAKNIIKDANKFFAERDGLEGYTLLQNTQNALFELENQYGINDLKNQLEDENLSDAKRNILQKRLDTKNKQVQDAWKGTSEYTAFEQYRDAHPSFDSTMSAYNAKQTQQEAMAQEYINLELAQQTIKGMYGVNSEEYKKATEDLNRFTSSFATKDLGFFAQIQAVAETYKETDEYKAREEKAYANTAKDYAKGLSKDKSAESQKSALRAYEQSRNKEVSLDKQLKHYQELQMTTSKGSAEWEKIQTIISSITAQLRSQEGITANIANNYLTGASKAEKGIIDKNTESKKETNENVHAYQQEKIASRQGATSFKEDMKNANQYYKEMTKINEDIAKLQGKANKSRGKTKEHYLNEIAQKEAYRKNIEGVYADRGIYYTYDSEKGIGTFKNAKGEVTSQTTNKHQAEAYYRDYTAMNLRYNERLRTTKAESQRVGFFDKMKGSIKGAAEYMMFTSLGYSIIGSIRGEITKIIQQTRQLEKTMTDLRIVTGGSEKQVQDLMYSYQDLGSQLGLTTAEVAASANEWLRMGYNAEQANTMIYNSAMLAKLGMIDTAKATEYMVSAVKGYNVAIEDAEQIVDMATALDMKYAVSAGYILEAMARTASGAKLAKVEMSELQSLIAIIGETTQKDASVIGESLKTAFSRYANVKATSFVNNPNLSSDENLINQYKLETEASESNDGTAVNDIEKVLKVVDIDIRNGEEWRSYSDILKEIGQSWKTYSDYEKNAIVTAMFGTRQRENGIVALTNYNRVLEANEVAINSVGTATKKMEIYSQGLEAAQNRVTAAWEKLVMDLEAGGVIQNVSETIESLIGNFKLLATVIGSGVLIANLDKVYVALTRFSVLFNSKMAMGASLGKGLFTGDFSKFKERMSNAHTKAQEIAIDGDNERASKLESKFSTLATATDSVIEKFNQLSGVTEQATQTEYQNADANLQDAETERINANANLQDAETERINANSNMTPVYQGGFIGPTPMNPNIPQNTVINTGNSIIRDMNSSYRQNPYYINNGVPVIQTGTKNYNNLSGHNYTLKSSGKYSKIANNHYENNVGKFSVGKNIGSMATGMIGMIGGAQLGSQWAEGMGLDETGQMMGSVIGGGLISTLSSSLMMGGHPIVGAIIGIGSLAWSMWNNYIEKRKEETLKGLNDDLAKIEEKYNNLTSSENISNVDRYEQLIDGVNSFGQNISLTNDEYEEFLSLSKTLGDLFPELKTRTDAFGNSLLGIGGNVGSIKEQFEELQKTTLRQDDYNYFKEESGASIASEDFKNRYKTYEKEQKKINPGWWDSLIQGELFNNTGYIGSNLYTTNKSNGFWNYIDRLSNNPLTNLMYLGIPSAARGTYEYITGENLSNNFINSRFNPNNEDRNKLQALAYDWIMNGSSDYQKSLKNKYINGYKNFNSNDINLQDIDLNQIESSNQGNAFYREFINIADKQYKEEKLELKKSQGKEEMMEVATRDIRKYYDYQDIDENYSNLLNSIVDNLDFSSFEGDLEKFREFLTLNILNPLDDNKDVLSDSLETVAKINSVANTNSLGQNDSDYIKNREIIKSLIIPQSQEDKEEYFKKQGYTYNENAKDGKVLDDGVNQYTLDEYIEQIIGENVSGKIIESLKDKFKDDNLWSKTIDDLSPKIDVKEGQYLNNLSKNELEYITKTASTSEEKSNELYEFLNKKHIRSAYSSKMQLDDLLDEMDEDIQESFKSMIENFDENEYIKFVNSLDNETKEKLLPMLENITAYANNLGLSFDETYKKASMLGNINRWGISSLTPNTIQTQYEELETILKAITAGEMTPELMEKMNSLAPEAFAESDPKKQEKIIRGLYDARDVNFDSGYANLLVNNSAFYEKFLKEKGKNLGLDNNLIKNIKQGQNLADEFDVYYNDGTKSIDINDDAFVEKMNKITGETSNNVEDSIEDYMNAFNINPYDLGYENMENVKNNAENVKSEIFKLIEIFIREGLNGGEISNYVNNNANELTNQSKYDKKSTKEEYQSLLYEYRDYQRTIQDHEEKMEDYAKQRRLNELEKELSEKSDIIQRFTNEISNYDWELELLPEIDYEGRIDVLGNKIGSLAGKNAELKKQMSDVANKTPKSAEEVQKLKETYDSLYSSLQENQKSIISIKKELNSLTVDALMSPFIEANNLFDKQKSVLEKATSLMTSSVDVEGSWKVMSFSGLYDFTEQSELEKKREEYESLLKEQENYQNKSLELNQIYQNLKYDETNADLIRDETRAIEDRNKAIDDFRKKIESFTTTYKDAMLDIFGSEENWQKFVKNNFNVDISVNVKYKDSINNVDIFDNKKSWNPLEKDTDILTVSDVDPNYQGDVITIPDKDPKTEDGTVPKTSKEEDKKEESYEEKKESTRSRKDNLNAYDKTYSDQDFVDKRDYIQSEYDTYLYYLDHNKSYMAGKSLEDINKFLERTKEENEQLYNDLMDYFNEISSKPVEAATLEENVETTISEVVDNVEEKSKTNKDYQLKAIDLDNKGWSTILPKNMNKKVDEAIDDVNSKERSIVAPIPDEQSWTDFGTRIGDYISNGIQSGVQKGLLRTPIRNNGDFVSYAQSFSGSSGNAVSNVFGETLDIKNEKSEGLANKWCAEFISDVARAFGIDKNIIPANESVSGMMNFFEEQGTAFMASAFNPPQRGDIGWRKTNDSSHIAIITGFDPISNTVFTIEGNTSLNGTSGNYGFVNEKQRDLSYFTGFGRPKYGISLADGTNYHQGGLALVGDENLLEGSNKPSPETVIYPNGQMEIVGEYGAELKNLPKGSQVLTTDETENLLGNIPSYASGTDVSLDTTNNILTDIKENTEPDKNGRNKELQSIDKIVPNYLNNIKTMFDDEIYKNLVLNYQNISMNKQNRAQEKNGIMEDYDNRILNETDSFKKSELKSAQALFLNEDNALFAMQTLNNHMDMLDYLTKFYDENVEQWKQDGDYDTINKVLESISSLGEEIEKCQKSVSEYVQEMYELSSATYKLKESYREHNSEMLNFAYDMGQMGLKTESNFFGELKKDAAESTLSAKDAFEDAKAALFKSVVVENGGTYDDFLAEMKTNETIQNAQKEVINAMRNEKQIREEEHEYFIQNIERAFNEFTTSIGMITDKTTDLLKSSLLTGPASKANTALEKVEEKRRRLNDHNLSEAEQRQLQLEINESLNEVFASIDEYLNGRLQNATTLANNTINQLTLGEEAGVLLSENKYRRSGRNFRKSINNDFYNEQIDAYENEREVILQTLVDREAELQKQSEIIGISVSELKKVDSIWNEGIEAYYQNLINVQEKLKEQLDSKLELIDMDQTILDLNKQQEWSSIRNIENYYNSTQSNLEAKRAELIDYMEMTEISYEEYLAKQQELAEINKQIIDSRLEELQAKQSFYNEQYSAMTFMVNEYTTALSEEKERVSDYYDEEIRKLQQVNDSKERSIKLTELQNNLENAQKEKKRVYRAGIGFVYENNRDEIKKAEDELDAFYRQDQLDSLNDAKEMELRILDDRIEGWNKYLEAIEKVYDTAERHHNMQLLKTMFGIEGEVNWDNIFEFLNSDMGSYLTADKTGEHIYYGELTTWLHNYTDISEDIYTQVAAIHNVLNNSPLFRGSNENVNEAMDSKELSNEVFEKLNFMNYEKYKFEETLAQANGKYWRDIVKEHPEITDFSSLTEDELKKYDLTVNEAKGLHNQKLIEMARWVTEGEVIDRYGNVIGKDENYKNIASILDGTLANSTNWSYDELAQARWLKLELGHNSGAISDEDYNAWKHPIGLTNENINHIINNPANQITTLNDLVQVLKELFKMSDNNVNSILNTIPQFQNIEGEGNVILRNYKKFQEELIASGKDIGDILKKSDSEIFNETHLTREEVAEARRIKQEKINNLVENTTDWESLKENNDSGLSYNDIIYAERLQKEKFDSFISKNGAVSKNQEWYNKFIAENTDEYGNIDWGTINNNSSIVGEQIKTSLDSLVEGQEAELGIMQSLTGIIPFLNKQNNINPIDTSLGGIVYNTNNPKPISLLNALGQNITNNNGNVNLYIARGTTLPQTITYATGLEYTDNQKTV